MKNTKTMIGIMLFLVLAMPFAIAQEENRTFEVKGGNEYPLLSRASDRIKLAFTAQLERRIALMTKIQERRAEHYEFLLAKGKTEEAERFNSQTIGLVKNFEDGKARKGQIVERFENKSIEKVNQSREDTAEQRAQDNIKNTTSART